MSKDYKALARQLVSQMTTEEKASLVYGDGLWNIRGVERLGVKGFSVSDGPCGIRKEQVTSNNGAFNEAVKAVAYPTPVLLASTWNKKLAYEMGHNMSLEAKKMGVDVILGPGVNHKRSPLCGRNFEYLSEDPLISGKLAANFINGVQDMGIGTCLKHFAFNNEENYRFINSSDIDDRASAEIYLTAFEIAIKESSPWSMMSSYNRYKEVYVSESDYLLNKVAREKFGFNGAFISDWGATSNIIESFKNGLNVEMPGVANYTKELILKAIKRKQLTIEQLSKACEDVVSLSLKIEDGKKIENSFSIDESLKTARKIVEEGIVLLENKDSILPLKKDSNIGIVGAFAKDGRYGGVGSSKVNPIIKDNCYDEICAYVKKDLPYVSGYNAKDGSTNEELIKEAIELSKSVKQVILFLGLPEAYEAEGMDRKNLDLPSGELILVEEIVKVNKNIIIVLQCGAPVILNFRNEVKGILLMYLAGCQMGLPLSKIIFGEVNPSGHLAETWPISLESNPSYTSYNKDCFNTDYTESIFTGYRYYKTVDKAVAYNFGYGLSYTSFNIGKIKLDTNNFSKGNKIKLGVEVLNSGNANGLACVQLYVQRVSRSLVPRPKFELKGFEKVNVSLDNKNSWVDFVLDDFTFRTFNTEINDYDIEEGLYKLLISFDGIKFDDIGSINVFNKDNKFGIDQRTLYPYYFDFTDNSFLLTEFQKILKPAANKKNFINPYTYDTPIFMAEKTKGGKILKKSILEGVAKATNMGLDGTEAILAMFDYAPLRFLSLGSIDRGGRRAVDAAVLLVRGKYISALLKDNKIKRLAKKNLL
ncbi:MAG: glycoside hydrolase family 3 C-terminal domain-containing protein [Acholeplasmatales bacterium]|jgi:beta-glucosidase|nr:glycoside hydrolase family 3 C-terminal domain-containing protein [Acholeplasmatales bacterium]